MAAAFAEARQGLAEGGIPIGAALVHEGRIMGRGHNRRAQSGSAVLHAEMDALENAGRQPADGLPRVHHVHHPVALRDVQRRHPALRHPAGRSSARTAPSVGEEALLRSRGVELEVLNDPGIERLLADFIRSNPALWNEDIGR